MTGPSVALLTPAGRGAVATLRVSKGRGEGQGIDWDALPFRAASGRPLSRTPINRIVFGRWGSDSPEDVVAVRTSENELEIHCHGGAAAVARILADLAPLGVPAVTWEAMLRDEQGEFAAELATALARAPTQRCAEILLDQASGLLRALLEKRVALALPVPGEDAPLDEHPRRHTARQFIATPSDARVGLEHPTWAEFGRHLTQPWLVVLTGRPNVGKSSLLNCLLGYGRAIVSEKPGTTRDVVTGETAIDGWPVRLADTAGQRATAVPLEAAGIERARRSLETADLQVVVLDRSQPRTNEDARILADWPEALVVASKCDLPAAWNVEDGVLEVSAATGEGLERLLKAISHRLVPDLPPDGTPVPFTPRQVEVLKATLDV